MNETGKQQNDSTSDGVGGSRAALNRVFWGAGKDLDDFSLSLRWRDPSRPLIYNVQLRAPSSEGQEVLMMVKAVIDGDPVIAFHSGRTMVECIRTWAARLNAGKITWREDEYPPNKFERVVAFAQKEALYFMKNWGGASLGAEDDDNT